MKQRRKRHLIYLGAALSGFLVGLIWGLGRELRYVQTREVYWEYLP